MTIQNIEDVMERIMSLNRNLNEESLKTLLSASGWDREDIMEGLRIFKTKNKKTVEATPVMSVELNTAKKIDIKNDDLENLKTDDDANYKTINNPYTFNLKNSTQFTDNSGREIKEKSDNILINKEEQILSNDNISKIENKFLLSKDENKSIIETKTENNKESNHNTFLGKLIFYILLLLILSVLLCYMFLPKFYNYVNEKLLNQNNSQNKITEINRNQIQLSENINNNQEIAYQNNLNNDLNSSSSSVSTNTNENNLNIEDLRKEIEILKEKLEKYKNQKTEEKTVIKYISQRGPAGPTGKNGRGIYNVDATSTGFLINYTDGTTDVVPYSTTTILNILNSQSVCFRDASSTSMMQNTDICLDRNTVLNLINK